MVEVNARDLEYIAFRSAVFFLSLSTMHERSMSSEDTIYLHLSCYPLANLIKLYCHRHPIQLFFFPR